MQINSLPPILQTEESKQKAKMIGAPALLSAGTAFIATKTPKGAEGGFKLSKRLSKSAKAGLITAAVMGVLSLKKDDLINVKNKVTGLFNRNKTEKQPAADTENNSAETSSDEPENITIKPQISNEEFEPETFEDDAELNNEINLTAEPADLNKTAQIDPFSNFNKQ